MPAADRQGVPRARRGRRGAAPRGAPREGPRAMKIRVVEHAKFQADKMAKIALATTSRAQLDLYCLEKGQSQKPHTHADQDKIYYVLEGRGRFSVSGAEESMGPGEAVVAPAGA